MNRRILAVVAALTIPLSATGRSLADLQVYVANSDAFGTGGNTIDSFSSTGSHLGAFPITNPWGVAVSPSGNVYATSGNLINVFSPSGTPLFSFGNSEGITPLGLAFDTMGNLLVGGSGLIERFSPTGQDLGEFATSFPAAWIAVASTGEVYASGGAAIDWLSASGQRLGQYFPGAGAGPDGMAFDSAGDLLAVISVAGTNGRIEKFSPTLDDLGTVVTFGNSFTPEGLALTPDGNLLVTGLVFNGSTLEGVIREFSPSGADLGTFASGLDEPFGIAVGASAVPEPSSLLLSGMAALGGMGFLKLRRRATVAERCCS